MQIIKRTALIIPLIIIGLIVIAASIFCLIETFHFTGKSIDFLRSYVDYNWLERYQVFVIGTITTLLLFTAAIFAILQLRASSRISYANLIIKLSLDWNSDEYINSRQMVLNIAPISLSIEEQRSKLKEAFQTSIETNSKDFFILTKPLDLFENLALLIRRNYIPLGDVDRSIGDPMLNYYNMFKDCIAIMREWEQNKSAYIELEEIAKELEKIRKNT